MRRGGGGDAVRTSADGLPTDRIGIRLRQWRAERGLAQEDVAALLDVDRRTVGRWERGLPCESPGMLVLALRALSDRIAPLLA